MKSALKGFTLIELVIYIGVLSILLTAMSALFTSIIDVQFESTSTSSVNQDGRYLLSKLLYDVKSITNVPPDGIVVPATAGVQSTTMQLTINSINYTYSLDSNNNLQVVNNSTGVSSVL